MNRMFGECHAHIFLNGRNYKEAVALHKKSCQRRGDPAGICRVSETWDYICKRWRRCPACVRICVKDRTTVWDRLPRPMFAIHRKGHYGRIVGCAWEDLEEYRDLVKKVKDLGGDFIKIMISGIMVYEQFGQMSEEPLAPEEIRELIHIAHEEGMAVMAHVNGADAVRAALLRGLTA